jgi:TonB family protein
MWLLRNPGPQPKKEVTPVMSDTFARAHDPRSASERRAHARQPIPSLAYVELDEGNGGIILNISEGGLSVQAVAGLMDDLLPGVRFQLTETDTWIEANARITWTNETRKLAGLEFVNLSEDCRGNLRKWLDRDSRPGVGTEVADARGPDETATAAADALPPVAPPDHAAESISPIVPTATDLPSTESTASSARTADIAASTAPEPDVEAASSVLADLVASVSVHALPPLLEPTRSEPPLPPSSVPPSPIPFRQPAETNAGDLKPGDSKSAEGESLIGNRWPAVVVLVALAVGSLAAGWAAGQGHLGMLLGRLRAMQGAEEIRGALQHLGMPAANPAEIEVENLGGQRWSIPFNGPLNSSADSGRRLSAGSSQQQPRKPQPGFRTWILSPPQQQTRTATSESGDLKEPPPVVSEASPANDNVLTSPGGARSLAPPPVLPVPAPAVATGIVKQAQLIHRVDPEYPVIAKDQHAEGTVRLNVTVGPDGIVRGVALLGGPRLLVDAAERAVRQWRYTPTLLDGKPVEFQREVDLTFRLSGATH